MDKAEMIVNEFEEIHNEAESYTTRDVWDSLENLALTIKEQGYSLGDEILERIRRNRLNEGLCPDCSTELTSKSQVVNISEAWGKPVCESCDKLSCSNCGWSSSEYED